MAPSRRVLVPLALVGALSSFLPAEAAQEVAARYVAGNDLVVQGTVRWASGHEVGVVCPEQDAPGLGGACIAIPARAKRVSLLVLDASTRSVGATVSFRTAGGTPVARRTARFCDTASLRIPSRAQLAVVELEQTVLPCPGNAGVPTTGTVLARFR